MQTSGIQMISERMRTVPTMLSRINFSVAQTDRRLLHIYAQNVYEYTIERTDGRFCIRAGRCFDFAHQVAALFYMKWRNGCHLESVTSNQKNLTTSTDVYLLEEQSCQISSRSDLKCWNLRLFWRGHPNKKYKNKMSGDRRSVPDLKMCLIINALRVFCIFGISLCHYVTKYQQWRKCPKFAFCWILGE